MDQVKPDLLVGYNNHSWDNRCIMYHCIDTRYSGSFIRAPSDKDSPVRLAFIIDIPGVNNMLQIDAQKASTV